MIRRPPRSTRIAHSFPTRRSSDLLIVLSFLGIWAVRGNPGIADRSLVLAAMGSVSSYSFGVIPLFILMGLFVDIANLGRDAFAVAAGLLRWLRGGPGNATVFGAGQAS